MPYAKDFVPTGKTDQFLKQQDIPVGKPYIVRFLSEMVGGYELWVDTGERKEDGSPKYTPVRYTDFTHFTPEEKRRAQPSKDGKGLQTPSEFNAVTVWDYQDEKIKTFSFTSPKIKWPILVAEDSERFGGDSRKFDIELHKDGSGSLTKYSAIALPPTPLDPQIEMLYEQARDSIDLTKLFDGKYPVGPEDPTGGAFDS